MMAKDARDAKEERYTESEAPRATTLSSDHEIQSTEASTTLPFPRLQSVQLQCPLSAVTTCCNLITQRYISYKPTVDTSRWQELPNADAEIVFCLPLMRKIISLPDKTFYTFLFKFRVK
ncbi:hypothetical protein PM082_022003 [Marasmius tenuissimus]|nr:hypothetical protein PM082_022003 [Marasmius tenuissimus]